MAAQCPYFVLAYGTPEYPPTQEFRAVVAVPGQRFLVIHLTPAM
jgi:hypothetical protein